MTTNIKIEINNEEIENNKKENKEEDKEEDENNIIILEEEENKNKLKENNKKEKKYFLKNRRNYLINWRSFNNNKWLNNRRRQLIENYLSVNNLFNNLILFKKSKIPKFSNKTKKQINNFGPLFLLISLFVYLLFGASTFLFLEHTNNEIIVRTFFYNLIINRNKYSKQISSAIFNGTKNMLIIVDYDTSERIQKEINNLLSKYEKQLELKMPDLNEWTLENSLTYCFGLITTIGHGHRSPKTKGGQVFALFYCLLGVPFFVFTLILISYRLLRFCYFIYQLLINKYFKLNIKLNYNYQRIIVCLIYFIWLIIFTLILFLFVIPESFWRSLYTAILSSLTIQSADYNLLNEKQKLIILIGSSISLLFSCICIITITGYSNNNFNKNNIKKEEEKEEEINKNKTKFNIIIDENGCSKLENSSIEEYSQKNNIFIEN